MLVDSHAHLDSPRYADDREVMLRRTYEAGVDTVMAIGIGEGPHEMHQALDLCRTYNGKSGLPKLYATAGVYPHNTPEIDDVVLAKLDRLLVEPEVIGCGEIGLDYYHEGAPHDVQRAGLVKQLEIAAARKRPIVIHCRPKDGEVDAWNHLFLTLDTYWRHTGLGGIMHCFSAGSEQIQKSIDMGFLISFAGNVTYPKAQPLRDAAAEVPLEHMLVETDAPWLTPMPDRGKRNEPGFVTRTAELLAGIKGVTPEELAAATTANFHRLFHLTGAAQN